MTEKQNFWTTTTGVITAVAGLLAAVAAVIGAVVAISRPSGSSPSTSRRRRRLASIFGAVIELRLGLARVCLRLRDR